MAAPDRGPFGDFQVRADLGAGRFGPVYRGEAAETGDPVIIRTVQATLQPAQRQALVESLQWLCETPLDHPAIGRPLACGLEGDIPFVVHSFVSGMPLDEFLDRRGPQPVDETIVRLTQLAGAIDFAAAAGVHHGAIDRRDVVLGAHHTAIAGFGLAQAAAQAGLAIETNTPYASPQQRAGHGPTRADDVYAIAVIALQLLCGRATDDDVPADLLELLREAGLSPALHDVFASALAEDRAARPGSALAFAAALQAALPPAGDASAPDTALPEDAPPAAPVDVPMRAGADDRDGPPAAPPAAFELPLMLDLPLDDPGVRAVEPPRDVAMMREPPLEPGAGRSRRHSSGRPDAALDADADAIGRRMPQGADAPGGITAAPLPFDPGADEFRDTTGTAADPALTRFGDPREWLDDGVAAAAPPSRPGSTLFETVDPPPRHRSYIVGAAVLAVLVLAGIAGGLLLGQSSQSVPFPRSAPQLGTSAGAPGDLASGDTGDAAGPAPAAGTGQPSAVEPGPPPEPLAEPIDEPPSLSSERGTPAGAAAVRDRPAEPPAPTDAPAPAVPAPATPQRPAAAPAAPAPSPRPDPPPGRVLVRSTPAGAQVLVNGEPRGTTPLAVRELAFGAHTIVVTHPSYGSRQQRVTLTADVPARSLDFDLDRPAPASPGAAAVAGILQVDSRPAGAQVFVNEQFMGTTPLVVPDVGAGSHVVRLELPGYRRWTTSVTVASGERVRIAASLEP